MSPLDSPSIPARSDPAQTPSPGSPATPGEPGVVRNTVLATLTQVVTAALTAGLTLYLTRALGPHAFGEFALAVGVAGFLLVPADLGISSSVGRFIAEHRHDRHAAGSFLASALALKLILGLLLSALLFGLAGPLADAYGNAHLTWPFRGAAVFLFGQSMFALYSSALVSTGRIAANLKLYTAESVAETAASVTLVALGTGAGGAAFGRAAGYLLGAAAGAVLAARVFGRRSLVPEAVSRSHVARIGRYAGVMFVVNGAWTLLGQTSVLLLGAYVGTTQVGLYSAPARISALLHYPGLAVQNSVAPRLARSGAVGPDTRSFLIALRYLVILQAILTAVVLVWAGPIIELLLGRRYSGSAGVLRAMAPFIYLQGLGPLVSVGVNYLGESRRRIPIAVGSLVVQLVLSVILIPSDGAIGAAIAGSVAYAIYLPAHLVLCQRLLSFSLRPLWTTVLRSTAAGALAALELAIVGTAHLTVAGWIGGAIGGGVVFLAGLVMFGEVTGAELEAARAGLARCWRMVAHR